MGGLVGRGIYGRSTPSVHIGRFYLHLEYNFQHIFLDGNPFYTSGLYSLSNIKKLRYPVPFWKKTMSKYKVVFSSGQVWPTVYTLLRLHNSIYYKYVLKFIRETLPDKILLNHPPVSHPFKTVICFIQFSTLPP